MKKQIKKAKIKKEEIPKVSLGKSPFNNSGAGTHGGTKEAQLRRDRKSTRQDLKNWKDE